MSKQFDIKDDNNAVELSGDQYLFKRGWLPDFSEWIDISYDKTTGGVQSIQAEFDGYLQAKTVLASGTASFAIIAVGPVKGNSSLKVTIVTRDTWQMANFIPFSKGDWLSFQFGANVTISSLYMFKAKSDS
jgi:hypothetical protein